MPLITVKVFKDELTPAQSTELIQKITDVTCAVTDEALRPATWVVIEEINNGQWGVGGQALSLDDVNNMIKNAKK